jgi:hypothetical protein
LSWWLVWIHFVLCYLCSFPLHSLLWFSIFDVPRLRPICLLDVLYNLFTLWRSDRSSTWSNIAILIFSSSPHLITII